MNYLYKYKSSLYKYVEKIKEKENYENFLKQVIDSKFSKEIVELVNFKDLDIGKEFQKYVNQNFMINQVFSNTSLFLASIPSLTLFGLGALYLGLGLGLGINLGISKIKELITGKKHNLIIFSDNLYYQYIPLKFREYGIPTLSWNGVSNKVKSFAIELIEDGNRKWLIINIKKSLRVIDNDNYLDVGDTIVDYKGISKNPYKVTFILYGLSKEQFSPEEWGVGDKDKIENNYSEKLSESFSQVATLDVF